MVDKFGRHANTRLLTIRFRILYLDWERIDIFPRFRRRQEIESSQDRNLWRNAIAYWLPLCAHMIFVVCFALKIVFLFEVAIRRGTI